jgi:NAD dependent epimerase/dehydratase family enzyme
MRRPAFLPVPGFALRLILGEKASLVLDGQRVLPKRLLAAGYDFHFEEMDPALRHLLSQK